MEDSPQFEDNQPRRHALIIGGTKGIGKATAKLFVQNGSLVSVIGRTAPKSAETGRDGIRWYQLDLTARRKLHSGIKKIVDSGGKLSSLVFCQRFRGKDSEEWAGEFDVSLTATKTIIDMTIDKFNPKANRSIVVVSSIAGAFIVGEQLLSMHVCKAALNQLVKYYAVALGKRGFRVNGVAPGTILKEESRNYYLKNKPLHDLFRKITPLGRMTTAEEVADVIYFLCSSRASAITGQNIILDGGLFLRGHATLARDIKGI